MSCMNEGCEKYLKGLQIGQDLQKRVKNGGEIDVDRITQFELQEMKRLACIDQAHTQVYGLTIPEAERYVNKFHEFLQDAPPPVCPEFKERVYACLKKNRKDTLKCSEDVRAFSNCVDDMMARNNRPRVECTREAKKKMSYREKFEGDCI